MEEQSQMVPLAPALQEEEIETAACWVQCNCNANAS